MQQSILSYRAGARRCCGQESCGIVFGNWGRSLVKTQPGVPEERITFLPQNMWDGCAACWGGLEHSLCLSNVKGGLGAASEPVPGNPL